MLIWVCTQNHKLIKSSYCAYKLDSFQVIIIFPWLKRNVQYADKSKYWEHSNLFLIENSCLVEENVDSSSNVTLNNK